MDAASIGGYGAADGPTAILVSQIFNSLHGSDCEAAAYSYMALVPIVQPAAIRLVTTKSERMIRCLIIRKRSAGTRDSVSDHRHNDRRICRAPPPASSVGFLMFGNLLRECGGLTRSRGLRRNEFAKYYYAFAGAYDFSFLMRAEDFVRGETLFILCIGLIAFVMDTPAACFVAKLLNVFSKNKINPMIGAAGISAFPMSARVVQSMATKEDRQNHLLMHADRRQCFRTD